MGPRGLTNNVKFGLVGDTGRTGSKSRRECDGPPSVLEFVAIWLKTTFWTHRRRKLSGIRIGRRRSSLLVIPDLFVQYNGRPGEEETTQSQGLHQA